MTLERILSEPRIQVRTRGGVALARSDDASSFVVSSEASDGPLSVGPYRPEYDDANHLLRVGAPLVSLRDNVSARGDAALAASYLQWLGRLSDRGLIEFPLVTEGVEHAIIVPQRPSFVPSLSAEVPANARSLDRFALLRRKDGSWVLESPLVGARFLLADLDSLDRPAVRCALSAAGFLEASHAPDDPGRVALAQWEFHDLLLHHHHRGGWHRDPIGATFPFIGEIEPLPARRPAWPGGLIRYRCHRRVPRRARTVSRPCSKGGVRSARATLNGPSPWTRWAHCWIEQRGPENSIPSPCMSIGIQS